ncbi:MAG: type II toxin-antitoxin system HicA family toxin [Lachnospiraceae bacterium]|nr:type II toxin-antitoxin system HicA family toxin [Lachnospiraceae bacterium]
MSKKDKLLKRLLSLPKDFTFDDMATLLDYFGYKLNHGGAGSGVKFIKNGTNQVINFHKPHPSGVLKRYVLEQVIEKLKEDGLI